MLSLVLVVKSGTWNDVVDGPFLKKCNVLSVRNNLLFWSVSLVVPLKLKCSFLQELHVNHSSVVWMKAIARSRLWWPGIDQAIKEFVNACKMCQEHAPAPPSQFVPLSLASEWERIHVNYGKINGKDVLGMVDAGSKNMPDTNTLATLKQMFGWFKRFGLPKSVHSDNGPQF
uniref:RNA-directed DNA polymerase n=1 Tax=Lepeophtheirus salmonis TaxID=72036 RepID=A0A0K2TY93_LEPSM